jgi:hypothetical protein
MSISTVQTYKRDLQKITYEELSKASRDDLLNLYGSKLEGFLYDYCSKYLKYSSKELTQMVKTPLEWLSKDSENDIQTDKSSKKIRLFKGIFDLWDYSSECLSRLHFHAKNDAALLYIPSAQLQTISEDLSSRHLYINGIFGCSDDRLDINSKKDILPIECKYIAIWISQINTSKLLIWTEMEMEWDEDEVDLKSLSSFNEIFNKNSRQSNQKTAYKKLISGESILRNRNIFSNLSNLYNSLEQISLPSFEFEHVKGLSLAKLAIRIGHTPHLIVKILESYDKSEDIVFIDEEKYNSLVNEYIANVEILNEDELTKEKFNALMNMMSKADYASNYTPLKILKDVDDLIIIETINYDYMPLRFEIFHPSAWNWSDYKNWELEDGVRSVVALKTDSDLNNETSSDTIALANYLIHYLKSQHGEVQLKIASENYKSYKEAWRNIKIPVPQLSDQKVITSALNKVNDITYRINALSTKLLINPLNAENTNNELLDIISKLEMLNDSERIIGLLKKRGRENKTVELKQTLRLDIRNQSLNKDLANASLKVICSFLNTDGGSLLIGVKDNGEVSGMDIEISQFHKNSFDGFKIWFGRLLDKKIGKNFLHLIDFELIKIHDEKHVLEVKCSFIKEGRGCYLDGKFYVRRNPYTEKLEGAELVEYCSQRNLI